MKAILRGADGDIWVEVEFESSAICLEQTVVYRHDGETVDDAKWGPVKVFVEHVRTEQLKGA